MTQDDILEMFRQEADKLPIESPPANEIILELAEVLAESRGRLPKETFETLVRIGGVLYKEGKSQFNAKSDVDAVMKQSARNHRSE